MKKIKLSLSLFLILSLNMGFSQIVLKVFDENKELISYATVALYHNDSLVAGTVSKDGLVNFQDINSGTYKLCVSFVGYKQNCEDIEYRKSTKLETEIVLESEISTLDEVSIKARRPTVGVNGKNNISIKVENTKLQELSTVNDLLRYIPGASYSSNGGLQIMGNPNPLILIDGKETKSISDLKNINPQDVVEIELLESHAALDASQKYAINIITKKRENYFGGRIYDNLKYKKALYNEFNLQLAYSKSKIQQTLSVSYNEGKAKYMEKSENRLLINPNEFYYTDYLAETDMGGRNNNLFYGLNYDIDSNKQIGFQINGGLKNNKILVDINSTIQNQMDYHNNTDIINGEEYLQSSINYSQKTKKYGNFSILADYYIKNSNGKNNILESTKTDIINSDNSYNIYSIKGDYDVPLKRIKSRLFAGVKVFQTTNKNFSEYISQEDGFDGSLFNTKNVLNERNISVYSKISSSIKKMSFEAGIRYELYSRELDDLIGDDNMSRQKGDIFPSLNINYFISDFHILSLNASKNINRQSYSLISNQNFYMNPYLYKIGNPFLQPEISYSTNLSYMLMQFIHISVGFSHSEDFTDMVLNSNDSIIIATHENFKKQTLFGNIGAWYQSEKLFANAGFFVQKPFYYYPKTELDELIFPIVNIYSYINGMYQLAKNLSAEASFSYIPKWNAGMSIAQPFYEAELGLKYYLLKSALQLGAGYKFQSISSTLARYKKTEFKQISDSGQHAVYVSVLYRFNANRKWVEKKTGMEEELDRIY